MSAVRMEGRSVSSFVLFFNKSGSSSGNSKVEAGKCWNNLQAQR